MCPRAKVAYECRGFCFHVDARESLKTGMALSHTYPCPFFGSKGPGNDSPEFNRFPYAG